MPTAMTNRWQSPVGFDCSEWASDLPVASSHPARALIPMGTVASRVIELQKLAKSSTCNGPPPPTRRENSRNGFGRRTTARFGKPASKFSQPDEQLQVDVEHGFLGLAGRRSNHMEEHAVVNKRKKLERAAGLHAQLLPSGRYADIPYDATSPWAFIPSSRSKKDIPYQSKRNPDGLNDSTAQSGALMPIPALLSQPSDGAAENGAKVAENELGQTLDLWTSFRDSHQQRLEPSSESFSTETTSTIRRQSVRDLYAYYGIRRPPGLVSPECVAGDAKDAPKSPTKYICCHVCFWFNALKSAYCKCGHQICAACEGILSDTGARSSRSVDETRSMRRLVCDHIESKTASNVTSESETEVKAQTQGEMSQRYFLGDELHGRTLRNPTSALGHEQCDLGGNVPALRAEGVTPNHGSEKHAMSCKELLDAMVQDQGSSMTLGDSKLITANTILSTNALLPGYSLGLLPVAMSTNPQPDQPSHCTYHISRPQHHKSQANLSPEMDTKEGVYHNEMPCHKVAQPGHARYREGSYPRKRRYRPDETDSGYAAGVSHLDERNTMGQESHSAEEDLGHTCLDNGALKALKHHRRPTATPQGKNKSLKQGHSSNLQQSDTCTPESTPSVLKHTDIHLPPKIGQVHDGSPVIPVSIRSKNQRMHDISRCKHYDGRCYGCSEHQSLSSSHTVRQNQYPVSFRMAAQSQSRTSSSQASSRKQSPESSNGTDRSIAALIFQKNTTGLWRTTEVPNTELQKGSAQGTPAASKQQFSKETFMNLKRKFETEKSEPEVAHLPEDAPSSISQANTSLELNNQAKKRKGRPSNKSISTPSNQPSGVCSSHKHKSTSRRLSAFFRLQEQNIVSTLNKRLQEHQEALKRMDSLRKDQLNLEKRGDPLTVEEVGRHERKRGVEEQLAGIEAELADKSEDCIPSRQEQRDMHTTRNGKGQEVMLLGLDTPKIVVETHWDGEHRHQWKRIVVQSIARTVESPVKIQEERFVGVNGITITIHMDGREDIMIKADLSR